MRLPRHFVSRPIKLGAAAKPDAAVLPVVRHQQRADKGDRDALADRHAAGRVSRQSGGGKGGAGGAVMKPLAGDPQTPQRWVIVDQIV
jgi:hypothetical protein